jgi:hypothetical protein
VFASRGVIATKSLVVRSNSPVRFSSIVPSLGHVPCLPRSNLVATRVSLTWPCLPVGGVRAGAFGTPSALAAVLDSWIGKTSRFVARSTVFRGTWPRTFEATANDGTFSPSGTIVLDAAHTTPANLSERLQLLRDAKLVDRGLLRDSGQSSEVRK